MAALGILTFPLLLFYLYVDKLETSRPVQPTTPMTTPQTPEIENDTSKLQAVEYLNRIRGEEGIPPVQLIDLSVAKYKAEYLARTNLFSHYDAEGRHPGYWYTQLSGAPCRCGGTRGLGNAE